MPQGVPLMPQIHLLLQEEPVGESFRSTKISNRTLIRMVNLRLEALKVTNQLAAKELREMHQQVLNKLT